MSWSMQAADLNPIEMVWHEFDRKVQLTFGNSSKKVGQKYLQSTSSILWKEFRESIKQL